MHGVETARRGRALGTANRLRAPAAALAVALGVALSVTAPVTAPIAGAVAGTGTAGDPGGRDRSAVVRQVGTYGYLDSPNYDGVAALRRVVGPRTSGLGTFSGLDGELVVLDGAAYRVGTDGTPRRVAAGRRTPFAQTVQWRPTVRRQVPAGTQCADLAPLVDDLLGTSGGIVAVRLTGRFRQLQTRSVERQHRPYPPLANAIAGQTVFDLDGRRAVLVGFRTGADLAGASPPGIHLHGLTVSKRAGGHVLSCSTARGATLSVQRTSGLVIAAG